jgi:hypothetical protein
MPWPPLKEWTSSPETKAELLKDLVSLIEIMHRDDFQLNYGKYKGPTGNTGYRKNKDILRRHKIKSLDKLDKEEIKKEISLIYKMVIRGGIANTEQLLRSPEI